VILVAAREDWNELQYIVSAVCLRWYIIVAARTKSVGASPLAGYNLPHELYAAALLRG
jgi:hypothetical protein